MVFCRLHLVYCQDLGPQCGQQEPGEQQKQKWLRDHLNNLYAFYGEYLGVQIARKHINWQLGQNCQYSVNVKAALMQTSTAEAQLSLIDTYFEQWNQQTLA